jgi:tetratricopeptide (TPR) repeat protein
MLLTMIVYVLAIARRSTLLVALLPVTTAAALGSKEIAVTLPLALAAYDWCFIARGNWRDTGSRWRAIALSALPLALGALFLLWRSSRPTGLGDYGATAGLGFDRFTRWQYLITEFGVLVRYLRLIVLPTGLTFDYDWPLQTTFFSLDVFLPLLALAALGTVAVRSVRSRPALAFAVLWMFIVLAPTSSFVPIADIAVERRMYLPIAGWALLGATALWDLSRRRASVVDDELGASETAAVLGRTAPGPAVFLVLATLPLAAWSVATYQRAALWADAIGLHRDGVEKAPGNPRVRLNLGVTYLNLHKLPEARRELAEAKRLFDLGQSVHCFRRIGAFIHYNLGAVLYMSNQSDEAVDQLQRSIELGGEFLALRPMAYYLLARIAVQHKDFDAAETRYEEALKYNKDNAGWFVELAGVYLKNKKPLRADNTVREGLRLHPDQPDLVKAAEHMKAPPPAQPPNPGRPKPAAPAPPADADY